MRALLNKIFHYFAGRDWTKGTTVLIAIWSLSKAYRDLQLLPMTWMDQSDDDQQGLLRRGGETTSCGPHWVTGGQRVEKVDLPDIKFRTFRNARVRVGSSSVICDDKKTFIERVNHPDQHKFVYSAGQILSHGRETAVVRLGDPGKIKRGIFLGGNGSFNYYHWLVEILPKLQFLPLLLPEFADYPLLISENVERISTFNETLNLFPTNREVVILKEDVSYVVDSLVYIDSPSNLPLNLRAGARFKPSYSHISSDSISYIRNAAMKRSESLMQEDDAGSKRIFLCRKEKRRRYNEDEVFECLAKFGFEKVYMGDLSFDEQLIVIRQAEWIVGPTGAAWTNLIFSQPGARCLCWMAEEFGDFSAFSTIAHVVGVDMQFISYKTGARSTNALYRENYELDVSKIEEWLRRQGCVM